MIRTLPQPKSLKFLWLAGAGFLLAACGSYQQASYYDNDGIYTEGEKRVGVEKPTRSAEVAAKESDGIYEDYFGQRADDIGEIMDNEIFTDVDDYYSGVEKDTVLPAEEYRDLVNDYPGFGGWGDNATSVEINVWPQNGWGWGAWNNLWWDPFWYGGLGYRGWGIGFGGYHPWIGPRFYNPWWYGGGFGWGYAGWGYAGWGYPGWGYGGYWGNPYYGYNTRFGYNRSRRGYYNNTLAANSFRGRSNLGTARNNSNVRYRSNSGRSNIGRNNTAGRTSSRYHTDSRVGRSSSAEAIARNRAYRSSRSTRSNPAYSRSSRSYQYYRSSDPRRSTYRRGTATNANRSSYRSTAPRRSTYNRSSSTSRSSGYRSSRSGPTRSSGYRSSSRSSSRSSGYRSAPSRSSRSSGSYRSSGSSRSSGSMRSSGGRSGGSRSSGISRSGGRRQ